MASVHLAVSGLLGERSREVPRTILSSFQFALHNKTKLSQLLSAHVCPFVLQEDEQHENPAVYRLVKIEVSTMSTLHTTPMAQVYAKPFANQANEESVVAIRNAGA
jgi:hypothetical protein